MQTSTRVLAPILKGGGKTLAGYNNQDAYTEAMIAQRKVRCTLEVKFVWA